LESLRDYSKGGGTMLTLGGQIGPVPAVGLDGGLICDGLPVLMSMPPGSGVSSGGLVPVCRRAQQGPAFRSGHVRYVARTVSVTVRAARG
jgi:hypothetical protein